MSVDYRGHHSIVGRIDSMLRALLILLAVPVIASLAMMLISAWRYSDSIQRMETIVALKPIIEEEIPEMVWNAVSGRVAFEESGAEERIEEVQDVIRQITVKSEKTGGLELTVAGRTMDTLAQYVEQVRQNMENSAPVTENEVIVDEIRAVAALAVTMLNEYINSEITASGEMSTALIKVVLAVAGMELVSLLLSICMIQKNRRDTADFVREPIEKLESATKQLAMGNMNVRLPMTQVEELWNLTGQVNIMADHLEEMLRLRVENERELKMAELRTLQAQINPHFLYNTLDAIVWKAETKDEAGVIQLTRALSDFFRISLSSGADWIPIEQEKKHIAGYLSIQKIRYSDILDYELDIPEEIGHYYILKLLLQPLVENALYHGIKYKRGGGVIRVTGEKQGDGLIFTVADTGHGMDEKTLARLRERLAMRKPSHGPEKEGFGLVNVNLRIRLYYNQAEGLKIESSPAGTTISFRVPIRMEAKYD